MKNTQLPEFLIADLYKNSLVIAGEKATREKTVPELEKPATERQWYLGGNLRKITLLVNEKEAVYLKEDALQFLSAILGACKLNLGDVAIINHKRDSLVYADIKEKLHPSFFLLFDVAAKEVNLPFTIPFYQVQKYDNCQFLLCPSLNSMLGTTQEAKLEKSKLWLSLKKMFGI